MRTSVYRLWVVCVAVACKAKAPAAPDASSPPVALELLAGQTPHGDVGGAVPAERAARLVTAVQEVDRRFSYYGAMLASRRHVGMVAADHAVVLAVPGVSGRCHRITFAAESPGVAVSLRNLSFRQGPVSGTTGALGQYRQVCPTSPVVYRLEITTGSAAPIAFAINQSEYPR